MSYPLDTTRVVYIVTTTAIWSNVHLSKLTSASGAKTLSNGPPLSFNPSPATDYMYISTHRLMECFSHSVGKCSSERERGAALQQEVAHFRPQVAGQIDGPFLPEGWWQTKVLFSKGTNGPVVGPFGGQHAPKYCL